MKQLALSIAAVALILCPTLSHAFQAGFARISMVEGDALIRTEESTEWLPASVNTPLYEGDSVWSPEGSRVEIQLQNNTYLRLDGRSSVAILALDKDFQQVSLGMGHLYVRSGTSGDNGLQVDVDDTSLMINDKTRARVDVTEEGDEEISLFKGSAYVEGNGGRTRLRTGETLTVEGGSSEVAPLNPPDDWERWNRERDRRLGQRRERRRYLPEELTVYSDDLDANGEWIEVPEYGHVWRPTVIVTGEWSPYREGRWVWRGDDYIWVSSESWGWAPYHYGRWVVVPGRGWCWVPPDRADVYWGPGYVGWVTTPTYVGWVPLAPGEVYYGRGYYGRNSVNIADVNVTRTNVTNVTTITNVNVTNVTYRNVAVNNAVTVVRKDAFAAGRAEKVKVRENIFTQKNIVALGAPAVRPVAKEARMPVVRQVSPAKLPPARVASVPVGELRERHRQLTDHHDTAPPARISGRGGPEQRKAPDEGEGAGRHKPVPVKDSEQHKPLPTKDAGQRKSVPAKEAEQSKSVPVKDAGQKPVPTPPAREMPRRDGENGRSPVQRDTPPAQTENRPGSRAVQVARPAGEKPAPLPPAVKTKKVQKEKQKENEKENKEKQQEH
jgi:hypothetical protein